ncbi:amidohydrolase [Halomonas sp. GXIMD04776]|uniref:amidohydrolase n=1 Tax=Halomonas sp. GXIMD04776 TaxID=3415605 RepID=UPI003CBAECF6
MSYTLPPRVYSRPHARTSRCVAIFVTAIASLAVSGPSLAQSGEIEAEVDLILHNGDLVTLDPLRPRAEAVAIDEGIIVATGNSDTILAQRGEDTRVIDLAGRMVIPGLNDSHSHVVRGGRFYNTELRWDGVSNLARAVEMVAEQAAHTPDGQWVRVIGGWSPFQFEERRMPTPAELTQAAPNTPVFVLFLYSRGFLNRAGVEALGITAESEAPAGGRYEITADGGAILHAEPNPTILYQTIGALPGLSEADQVNSTRQFYRELNRFGVTSAVDAGGGGHLFPTDYVGSQRLADEGAMPLRVSNYLFPQRPGEELEDFKTWTENWAVNVNLAETLAHGFVVEGGGEFLVWAAGDFENFTAEMPDITTREGWRQELMAVTRHLLRARWPIRIHATYDESVGHILDVFEAAHAAEREAGRPGFAGVRWAIEHAETVSVENLRRIAALGGGVAIQARMAYAGEYFIERYGQDLAARAPPIRDMIELGIPVGAGTDATRVASYNPWIALHWLVTGKTVGGTETRAERHRLSREEALSLYTVGSAWFSGEEALKGRLAPGQFADLAVLSADYLAVPEEEITEIESVLTVTGGNIVHGAGPFADLAPELPKVSPEWSPVSRFGGYANE